jgi:thiol-disulfide isomerase/thioredoxin
MVRTCLGVAALWLAVAGCGGAPSPQGSAPSGDAGAAAEVAWEDVELTIGGVEEYEAFLAAHRGEVILVDFWATWCSPCVAAFPHTVALSDKYRAQGLATMAVSLDDPENVDTVRAFLAAKQASFPNLLSKFGGGTDSMEAFDLNAAVPHYRLYNRQGELAKQWDGEPDDLEEQIVALLGGE